MIKAIIFDMDGVLIDSVKYLYEAFNLALKKYDVYINNEDIKKYLGKPMREKIKMWKEEYNIKEDIDIAKFSKEVFELEMNLLKENVKVDKNLLDLVQSLKENNLKLAVATSSPKSRAENILELIGLKENTDVLLTDEDFEKSKPNPDIFLKTAERLGVNPEECVVIEDAVNGIIAAKNAGMKSIALLTKYHGKDEFNDADLIINSLVELNLEKIQNLK